MSDLGRALRSLVVVELIVALPLFIFAGWLRGLFIFGAGTIALALGLLLEGKRGRRVMSLLIAGVAATRLGGLLPDPTSYRLGPSALR